MEDLPPNSAMTQQVCARSLLYGRCADALCADIPRTMYELRGDPQPSYAQLDGTEPEFEVRRVRRVAVQREQARLIVVSVRGPIVAVLIAIVI